MPKALTGKDERQYEKVKKSQSERGADQKRAKEIAAATVNKQRRQEGRTPNNEAMGKGNPNQPLENRTREELYNIARERRIPGRSKMNKGELVSAIRNH